MPKSKQATAKSKSGAVVNVTLLRLLNSKTMWEKFAKVQKSPGIAYKITRFLKTVLNEYLEIIGSEHRKLLEKYSTAEEGKPASINEVKDPEKAAAFNEALDAYLAGEVEIPRIDVTMDELIESLSSFEKNSTESLELIFMELEDFFLEARPAK